MPSRDTFLRRWKPLSGGFAVVALTTILISNPWTAGARQADAPWAAPELTHVDPQSWINSDPLTLEDLKGKVVLVDFWTYGCWNCYRSFPWLNALEDRLKQQAFQVIGVHTPEFAHEKNPSQVSRKTREFGLAHPVMLDDDFSFWRAMNNQYWPTFYLIDKTGQVRAQYVGEVHAGDYTAEKIEAQINQLLLERSS